MGFTCRNFIYDPRIVTTGRKITRIVPDKMAPKQAYEVFLVALSTMGLTVVPKGKLLRIVEAATARRENVPISRGPPGDRDQIKSKIGENIPVSKGVVPSSTLTANATLVNNVDRQNLELELAIKPHISADDNVLLEIKHNASGLKDASNPLGPVWTTRNVETRVVVRDQQPC